MRAKPGGLSAVKQPLALQQQQYDKNTKQAAALPAVQRAKFAEQFQQTAARKDPSTVRPGTTMGKPGGLGRIVSGINQVPDRMDNPLKKTGLGRIVSGINQVPDRMDNPLKKTGLGTAVSGPKVGVGTAMGANKMAGAGAALGKKFGMKSGGVTRADGCITKGKTKGKFI